MFICRNPRVPCRSGVLPSIDFSKWADNGANDFHAKPFASNFGFDTLLGKK